MVMKRVSESPVLRSVWALIYRKWLWNDFYETYAKVIAVRGWRTALIAELYRDGSEAGRKMITPCFWGLD